MRDYRAVRFASINLGLLLLFALNPYPRWLLPQGMVQVFFLVTTILAVVQGRYFPTHDKKNMLWAILIYIVWFTLPVVHQFKVGYFLYYLIFIQILFFDYDVYLNGYLLLKKIMVIVCVSALIVWLIHLAGFHLPHYAMTPEWRQSAVNDYHIYGPCLSLFDSYHRNYQALERICGVFAEPGHFGIYLGLMLAVEKFELDSKENLIMLFTGILTFSTAFYGILGLGIAYRMSSRTTATLDLKNIVIALLIVLPFIFSNSFFDTAVGRVAKYQKGENTTINSIIDSRTTAGTQKTYTRFASGTKFLTGNGMSEDDDIQITNWRGYIFRYGVIGGLIALILTLMITYGQKVRYQALLVAIGLLIFSHRSYIMYQPGIYMMLFIANMISNAGQLEEESQQKDHLLSDENN